MSIYPNNPLKRKVKGFSLISNQCVLTVKEIEKQNEAIREIERDWETPCPNSNCWICYPQSTKEGWGIIPFLEYDGQKLVSIESTKKLLAETRRKTLEEVKEEIAIHINDTEHSKFLCLKELYQKLKEES